MQAEWIYARHRDGKTDVSIINTFHETFGLLIGRRVIEYVVQAEAMPKVKSCNPYRCPGCSNRVNTKPCMQCTIKRINGTAQ